MKRIYLLENCKGKSIEYCNAVLRDLGIDGYHMLGELKREGGYKKNAHTD